MKKGTRNQERNPESSRLITDDHLDKSPGAYTVTDSNNDVVYAGSSNNLYQRYHEHRHTLKKGTSNNKELQKCSETSLLKFNGFHTETREAAFDMEQKFIDKHINDPKFCNISTDARVHAKGHVITKETQQKMSLSRIGIPKSEECKEKIRIANLGKKKSPESIVKMRESKKGKTLTEEHKLKISEGLKRAHSEK